MRSAYALTTQYLRSRTLVLIVAGQSIGANYCAFNPTCSNVVEILNPYDRAVYAVNGNTQPGWAPGGTVPYSSALMGASGYFAFNGDQYGGSWVPRLADLLISSGLKSGPIDRCIIINVAIGSSFIAQWSTGALFQRLAAAWGHCVALGWAKSPHFVPAVLWCQGEADTLAGTTTSAWAMAFNAMVSRMKALSCNAPWFVPVETISEGHPVTDAANQAVRNAQVSVRNPTGNPAIFGSDVCDFDLFAPSRRYEDGTHPDSTSGPQMAELLQCLIFTNL
jgi:hypothetical protein